MACPRLLAIAAMAAIGILPLGCGGPEDLGSAGAPGHPHASSDEPIASVSSAVTEDWWVHGRDRPGPNHTSTDFYLGQGSYTGRLKTLAYGTEPSFCVLTNVYGRFDSSWDTRESTYPYGGGAADYVGVDHGVSSSGGEYWQLAAGIDVGGEAYCFNRNKFLANGTARWVSSRIQKGIHSPSNCYSTTTGMWWGDAASILNGVQHKYNTPSSKFLTPDEASITQSTGPFTPSALFVNVCNSPDENYHWGSGYSFFVGEPQSGSLPKFWGSEYSASLAATDTATGYRETLMAPVNDAMCYFTHIDGRFRGGGESVKIAPKSVGGVEYWNLSVSAGKYITERNPIKAKARCLKRDQR